MTDRNRSSMPAPTGAPDPQLDAQAADWLLRRGADDWSAADDQAHQHWLAASPAHRSAYAHAQRMWDELAGLKQAPEWLAGAGLGAEGTTDRGHDRGGRRHEADASHPTHERAHPATHPAARPVLRPALRPTRPALRPTRLAHLRAGLSAHRTWAAATFATVALAAVLGTTGGDPLLALQADHRTATGQTQDLTLPDGSRIHLGAGSAVALHFDDQVRRVDLLRGEALFEAAPVRRDLARGEHRPFVVAAAQGRTRALGTRFLVERLATHTRVTGVEHQVAVALDTAPQAAAILSPGQAVRYDERGVSPVEAPGLDAASAWSRGLLVFERTELADVVARLNRHHGGHIAIRGEALARRTVSGVFPAGQVDGALQSIADELGARVLRLPGLVLLY